MASEDCNGPVTHPVSVRRGLTFSVGTLCNRALCPALSPWSSFLRLVWSAAACTAGHDPIRLEKFHNPAENQPHPHGGDEKAGDACCGIDPFRPDLFEYGRFVVAEILIEPGLYGVAAHAPKLT